MTFKKSMKKTVRVIDLNGNFGQHMAITSGFANVRGKYIITLDADLQIHQKKSLKSLPKWMKAMM